MKRAGYIYLKYNMTGIPLLSYIITNLLLQPRNNQFTMYIANNIVLGNYIFLLFIFPDSLLCRSLKPQMPGGHSPVLMSPILRQPSP